MNILKALKSFLTLIIEIGLAGLTKLDSVKKGWKRHTTSAIFAGAGALAFSFGIDLSLYVENVEAIWAAGGGLYLSIMTLLKVAADQGGA